MSSRSAKLLIVLYKPNFIFYINIYIIKYHAYTKLSLLHPDISDTRQTLFLTEYSDRYFYVRFINPMAEFVNK